MTNHEKEIEHWRFVAAYLASCHAATLEGLPKSASKCSRRRYVAICKNAIAYLRGEDEPPNRHSSRAELIELEIKRCEDAVKNHAE